MRTFGATLAMGPDDVPSHQDEQFGSSWMDVILLTVFPVHIGIPPVAVPAKHGSTVRNIAKSGPWRARESSELEKLPCQSQNIQADEAQRQRCQLHHDKSSTRTDGYGMRCRE